MAVAPAAIDRPLQLSTDPLSEPPPDALTKVPCASSALMLSVAPTPVASAVPVFETSRKNLNDPAQVSVPVTPKAAESFADTMPVPIESPPVGMGVPSPAFGVVTSVEPQAWNLPSAKSFRSAVIDGDEIHGVIAIHHGDKSEFVAIRKDQPRSKPKKPKR